MLPRRFLALLIERVAVLGLHVRGLEASTLIELTAFGTAVMMNYRYTDALDGTRPLAHQKRSAWVLLGAGGGSLVRAQCVSDSLSRRTDGGRNGGRSSSA